MSRLSLLALAINFGFVAFAQADNPKLEVIRSAGDGRWSLPATWEGGKVPAAGANVLIRTGHHVVYDVSSDAAIRSVHISGGLSFDRARDTKLVVGLLKVQPGEVVSDDGFDCDAHAPDPVAAERMPVLEIGSSDQPIPAGKTALIRLIAFDGTDKDSWPAIVCCAGRMDIHGAPMNRTWAKLGADAKKGAEEAMLAEKVSGWRVGDKVIITGTKDPDERIGGFSTEERTIAKIDGERMAFDEPLTFEHAGTGEFRGEIANLSRNVVIESADPAKARGHTMYQRNSAGSLSYAEFRHLGKQGVLGRYSIHFHLVGNSMRGSSVVGVSVWDSGNRWITVHGTNYLVVRDCVGFKSVGHGFFLEDGTEVYNVFDRNLAVHAMRGKRLPKQVLPFDANDGAGYWWANSLNTFTRNVSCENERYGYRFEAIKSSGFNPTLQVMQPDGSKKPTDIRTLPFVRFEDNETHGEGLYGFNLAEGVNRVGPDDKHPFIIRNMRIWQLHYGFRPQSPNVLVENMTIQSAYGVYHPNYDNHVYRNLRILRTNTEPFNRGHDDDSVQYGRLIVDGLTFDNIRSGAMPLIQISDDNPTGAADSHFRNLTTVNWNDKQKSRAVVNLGGGPRPQPKTEKGVPIYLHDYYGSGRHAMIVSTRSPEFKASPDRFRSEPPLTGDESRVAEVKDISFPELLHPVDDLPPATVITSIVKQADGKLLVRGISSDNGTIVGVLVNGKEAKSTAANFSQWEARIVTADVVTAHAEDSAGNVEKLKHELKVK